MPSQGPGLRRCRRNGPPTRRSMTPGLPPLRVYLLHPGPPRSWTLGVPSPSQWVVRGCAGYTLDTWQRDCPKASTMVTTTIAIDWSGAAKPSGKIWMACAHDGELATLLAARGREHAISWLLEQLNRYPNAIAGLDFAFSMPRWFVESHGVSHAKDFWPVVQQCGERWLDACDKPFGGKPNKKKPDLGRKSHFRRTETEVGAGASVKPKSVFQIGGAGAVGTGSIRGMPYLTNIRRAGVAIWPFDPPSRPMVVEIYPRLFTGQVVKSKCSARFEYLNKKLPRLNADHWTNAMDSEDAFDAAISAIELNNTARTPSARQCDDICVSEGEIWH